MGNESEKPAKTAEKQTLTLKVKLLRFTVVNDHFVLATVGWLSSYRDILPEAPTSYVFPTSKNLDEEAEYTIEGNLRKHDKHGLRFHISRFKRLSGSSSASWMNKQTESSKGQKATSVANPGTEPPQFEDSVKIEDIPSGYHSPQPLPLAQNKTKYPELVEALLKGSIPTIGVDTAKRLYIAFGDSLFEFTDGAPLVGLTGFGERRAFTTISNLRTYMNVTNPKST